MLERQREARNTPHYGRGLRPKGWADSQTSPTSGDWIENLNKLASAKETLAKLLGVPTEAGPRSVPD